MLHAKTATVTVLQQRQTAGGNPVLKKYCRHDDISHTLSLSAATVYGNVTPLQVTVVHVKKELAIKKRK
jgi:hypothetical protein